MSTEKSGDPEIHGVEEIGTVAVARAGRFIFVLVCGHTRLNTHLIVEKRQGVDAQGLTCVKEFREDFDTVCNSHYKNL